MKVIVVCECSGVVRQAFRRLGHDAWSCDLKPAEDDSPYHFEENCFGPLLREPWDMMIAHPPCTYLSSSGIHHASRDETRSRKIMEALQFVRYLMSMPIEKICIENPVGIISTQIAPPTQIIQPWQFGEDASKTTCLWLAGLPPLEPTVIALPRLTEHGKMRWSNQTDNGANKLSNTPDRATQRSRTYPGIAAAMADQWGGVVLEDDDLESL